MTVTRTDWIRIKPWRPWGKLHVVASLLASAKGPSDAAWIIRYYVNRRGPKMLRRPDSRQQVRLKGLPGPLHLSDSTGGLATYYEIVRQSVYTPTADFRPKPGQTVVDIGANIGVFSLWAADLIGKQGRLLAVEPHPDAVQVLTANLRAVQGQAEVIAAACSDTDGELVLHVVPGLLSLSSGKAIVRKDATESIIVQKRTLHEILDAAEVESVDLLKIDVEGLELEVLRGADEVLVRVRRLVLEIGAGTLPAAVAYLAEHGLHLVHRQQGAWGLPWELVGCFERSPSQA